MIKAYFGSYHSGLESHFLDSLKFVVRDERKELKHKVLIIVPSTYLKEYLIKQLFELIDFSLINVHFLTLDGFARNVVDYAKEDFYVVDNYVFYAKLLQERLRNIPKRFFQYVSRSYGASVALYNSIRDIYDANLLPDELIELIDFIKNESDEQYMKNEFGHKDLELLHNVAQSYKIFYDTLQNKNIVNNSRLLQIASENAVNNPFISDVKSIFWYGFYDTTQTQFNFIDSTTRVVFQNSGDIYFYSPIDVDSSNIIAECKYARTFYQDLIILINFLGRNNIIEHLPVKKGVVSGGLEYNIIRESIGVSKIDGNSISILSCVGPYEEVLVCAKEILLLIDSGRYTFSDIAVVARTMEPYSFYINTIFKENNIPFYGGLQDNFMLNPVSRFMLNILYACLNDLPTVSVLEIISSRYYKHLTDVNVKNIEYILDKLYIRTKEDWTRLKSLYYEFDDAFVAKFLGDGVTQRNIKEVIDVLDRLDSILSRIVFQGRMCDIVNSFFGLLKEEFNFDKKDMDYTDRLFTKFIAFEHLDSIYSLEEFIHVFEELIKNVREKEKDSNGVVVLDVMKFRGLSYKVVFILGMNKDVFPREIVPEPFISDSIRYKIDYFAGAKIKQKRRMAIKEMGYDEEFILFYYTLKSAKEKIYLLYQRADAKGNLLSPSYYLEKINYLLDECQKDVPKDIIGKYKFYDGVNRFIPSKNELSILLSMSSNALDVFPLWFEKQYNINEGALYIKTVADFSNKINAKRDCSDVDGFLVDKSNQIMEYLKNKDGKILLSQSALSSYKKCPFMFFAERILKIDEVDEEEKEEFVSMLHLGKIVDMALKYYFQQKNMFDGKVDNRVLEKSISYAKNMYKNILNPIQLDYALDKVKTAITNFLSDKTYNDWKVIIPQEQEEIKRDIGDVVLTGIPDAIFIKDNISRIVDFKYGGKKYSYSEGGLYNEGLLQFVVYPIVYFQTIDDNVDFKYENLARYSKYVNLNFLKKIIIENHFGYMISDGEGKLRRYFTDTFGRISDCDAIKKWEANLRKDISDGLLSSFFIIHKYAYSIDSRNVCSYCNFFLMCRRSHFETQKRTSAKWKQINDKQNKKKKS